MRAGDRVRFTSDNLGILATADSLRFERDTVGHLDEGTYVGPHETLPEADWHIVRLDDDRVVPVHVSQFEVIS